MGVLSMFQARITRDVQDILFQINWAVVVPLFCDGPQFQIVMRNQYPRETHVADYEYMCT